MRSPRMTAPVIRRPSRHWRVVPCEMCGSWAAFDVPPLFFELLVNLPGAEEDALYQQHTADQIQHEAERDRHCSYRRENRNDHLRGESNPGHCGPYPVA